jgi:hypothetical protein
MAFWKRRADPPAPPPPPPAIDWQKTNEASRQIVDYLADAYNKPPRGVHAETVIGAAAALAGAYAQRSVFAMEPGTGFVLSDEVSDLMLGGGGKIGRPLVEIILRAAESAGAARDQLPDPLAINTRVVAAFGSTWYPPLSVPESNYPHEWSPNATVRHRERIDAILAGCELNSVESAVALTDATAELLKWTAKVFDPRLAATLALEVMISVAKLRPLDHQVGPVAACA